MNDMTPLHVLWGVYNNPHTPTQTKEKVEKMIAKAIKQDKSSKLSKKLAVTFS